MYNLTILACFLVAEPIANSIYRGKDDNNDILCPEIPVSSLWSDITDETLEDIRQSSLSIHALTQLHGLDKSSACKPK
jgi:hypothetical protein